MGTCVVYVLSWSTLIASYGQRVAGEDVAGTVWFVLAAGIVGIVFASLAPVAFEWYERRGEAPAPHAVEA